LSLFGSRTISSGFFNSLLIFSGLISACPYKYLLTRIECLFLAFKLFFFSRFGVSEAFVQHFSNVTWQLTLMSGSNRTFACVLTLLLVRWIALDFRLTVQALH
jgi:hypothetical protein